MIDLKYSLVIEATDDPTFSGFYSPDLEGFTIAYELAFVADAAFHKHTIGVRP